MTRLESIQALTQRIGYTSTPYGIDSYELIPPTRTNKARLLKNTAEKLAQNILHNKRLRGSSIRTSAGVTETAPKLTRAWDELLKALDGLTESENE